jgi:hypothetical protein
VRENAVAEERKGKRESESGLQVGIGEKVWKRYGRRKRLDDIQLIGLSYSAESAVI